MTYKLLLFSLKIYYQKFFKYVFVFFLPVMVDFVIMIKISIGGILKVKVLDLLFTNVKLRIPVMDLNKPLSKPLLILYFLSHSELDSQSIWDEYRLLWLTSLSCLISDHALDLTHCSIYAMLIGELLDWVTDALKSWKLFRLGPLTRLELKRVWN